MAEEYSRKAVFEILGQEVPDKEMQRAESYADRKLERAQKCSQRTRRRTAPAGTVFCWWPIW